MALYKFYSYLMMIYGYWLPLLCSWLALCASAIDLMLWLSQSVVEFMFRLEKRLTL